MVPRECCFAATPLVFSYIHLTYLPAQSLLAEAVPEDEEDCPCTSRRPVIRNQSKGSACGVSMVGVSYENSLRDLMNFAFGGSHFLHIFFLSGCWTLFGAMGLGRSKLTLLKLTGGCILGGVVFCSGKTPTYHAKLHASAKISQP